MTTEDRDKKRAADREYVRRRYAEDLDYRERQKAASRARYAADPQTAIDYQIARQRERYATDSEYREKVKAKTSARQKERYATDPEYREKVKAAARRRYHEKKAAKEAAGC